MHLLVGPDLILKLNILYISYQFYYNNKEQIAIYDNTNVDIDYFQIITNVPGT